MRAAPRHRETLTLPWAQSEPECETGRPASLQVRELRTRPLHFCGMKVPKGKAVVTKGPSQNTRSVAFWGCSYTCAARGITKVAESPPQPPLLISQSQRKSGAPRRACLQSRGASPLTGASGTAGPTHREQRQPHPGSLFNPQGLFLRTLFSRVAGLPH